MRFLGITRLWAGRMLSPIQALSSWLGLEQLSIAPRASRLQEKQSAQQHRGRVHLFVIAVTPMQQPHKPGQDVH